MSGGVAYVFDEDGQFSRRCNTSMVTLDKVPPRGEQAGPAVGWHREMADEVLLKKLVEDHHKWTGSLRAREILDTWPEARGKFVKVFPHEYKRVLAERAAKAEAAAATGKAMSSAASVAAK
jgi:glutamate synthase (NADPH/NADH) large chain